MAREAPSVIEPISTVFAEYWNSLHGFRARMFNFMQNYDVILSPVHPTPALKHGASTLDENFMGFSLHHDAQFN